MGSDRGDEAVAYSVQDLGGLWRWRVYRGGGQVIRQGVEATAKAAERAGAALILDGAGEGRRGAVAQGVAGGRCSVSPPPSPGHRRRQLRTRTNRPDGTRPAPEASLGHV